MKLLRNPLVLAALYYFMYFSAGGVVYPYMNLYFQSAGMTNQQIGLLVALPTVMTVFASPLWSMLADRLNLHHLLLPGLLFAAAFPTTLLFFAAGFWAHVLLVVAYALFNSPVIALAENGIVTMLGDRRDRYGAVRLWGAVGFGLSSLIMGQAAERWGFAIIWPIYAVLILLTALVALRLPVPEMQQSVAYLKSLRGLMRDTRWLGFLVAVLLVGIGYAMYDNFYALHLKALGASSGLLGLIFMVATLSELPVFFFSTWLIRRLTLRGVMMLAFAAFAVRGLLWSFVVVPEWGLGVQLLHGLSFSALWTAGVLYVARIAPQGLGASAQALFGVMLFGLSRAIGAMIGARLYDLPGPTVMFQAAALVSFIGLLMFVLNERSADVRRVPVA